jgi:hypothetical protein
MSNITKCKGSVIGFKPKTCISAKGNNQTHTYQKKKKIKHLRGSEHQQKKWKAKINLTLLTLELKELYKTLRSPIM